MISHKYHCIFVEVPKTGTTSIRSIIGFPPKEHLNIWQIKYHMETFWTHYDVFGSQILGCFYQLLSKNLRKRIGRKQFNSYYKFGFVRNPWDRVVSLYERKQGLQMKDKMTFEEFVEWAKLSSSTCLHPVPHRNQLDWFIDPHGNVIVDFIGKFEKINEDWAHISQRLGINIELPHHKKRPDKKHYSEYYTDKTRKIVAERFKVDIEYFDYSFEKM